MTAQTEMKNLVREDSGPKMHGVAGVAFETVEGIDDDADLAFQLRGNGYNPLVDAAMPLFGLAIRIRKLEENNEVQALYDRVHVQIAAITQELRALGYGGQALQSYQYCLCTFLDEIVMATRWGAESIWGGHSLLSAYHQETSGGEKFFSLLKRLLSEPEQNKDLLEFMYLCLCLGFKGQHTLRADSNDVLQGMIEQLHRALRPLRGDAPERLIESTDNAAPRSYRFARHAPWWTPWAVGAGVLAAAYALYAFRLRAVTAEVLQALDRILA